MIQSIEEGRKQDGNRSIADKIIKRLHDLEKTVENNFGRWAWELLQNAKDSIVDDTRAVNVCLKRVGDEVTFSHNGNYFTEHDIRGLINQISSKEVEEGQKSTRVGRFGTGFITTHLLSKVVQVRGIVETKNKELYKFEFPLDREGGTTSLLAPKIEATWQQFHQSAKRVLLVDPIQLNTSFTYILKSERQRRTAQKGIEEFIRLIPFVLAFIPKIGKVTIINGFHNIEIERIRSLKSDFIIQISKKENNQTRNIQIALCQNEIAAVAIEIEAQTQSIKKLNNVPRLFCDFPLIGTEKFHFPVIVNSFYFIPQTERDGVWLKGNEDIEVQKNQEILVEAVSLYENLISKLSKSGIKELYHAATTKLPDANENYFDADWYKKNVQKLLREAIIKTPLVDTVSKERKSIEFGGGGYVDFPHHENKNIRERLWKLGNNLGDSNLILPEKHSIEFWDEIIWDKKYYLDLEKFADFFTHWGGNIEDFKETAGEVQDVFEWLNDFYSLIIDEEQTELFDSYELVPNQNGNFKKIKESSRFKITNLLYTKESSRFKITNLLYTDEIKDETLIEILQLLGDDWKEYLIHPGINMPLTSAVLKKQDIATAITKVFSDIEGEWSDNAVKAIVSLSEWFEFNPELGKELFPELYRRRAELFMNTIDDKESLYQVMKSRTPLATLSEIALAIENDPEILNIIARRQQEIIEEKERNKIGEVVESILAEVLRDYGFTVQKTHVGRDLIISLDGKFNYDIEVKSTKSGGFVSMTPTQAQTAVGNPNNYALCVVQKNGQPLTKRYIRANSKFIIKIGTLIKGKVETMANFNNSQVQLLSNSGEIGLLFENSLSYKYKVSQSLWTRGYDIDSFIQFLKTKN